MNHPQHDCATPRQAEAHSSQGSAGYRLRPHLSASLPEPLLREIATDTLGAVRCSRKYLDALRIVIGNQADAELFGYLLELNTRTPFATTKTMRTILGQLEAVGLTFKKRMALGHGRVQYIHCHRRRGAKLRPADMLNVLYRRTEGSSRTAPSCAVAAPAEVPY